jgi:hypothetical protein
LFWVHDLLRLSQSGFREAPLFYLFNLADYSFFLATRPALQFPPLARLVLFIVFARKVAFKSLYRLLLFFKPGFHPGLISTTFMHRNSSIIRISGGKHGIFV